MIDTSGIHMSLISSSQATYDVVTGKDRGQTVSKCVESNLINIKVIEPVELKIFLLNLKVGCV